MEFWTWKENWILEDREEVTWASRMEGREGVRRRAENQPRRESEVGEEGEEEVEETRLRREGRWSRPEGE